MVQTQTTMKLLWFLHLFFFFLSIFYFILNKTLTQSYRLVCYLLLPFQVKIVYLTCGKVKSKCSTSPCSQTPRLRCIKLKRENGFHKKSSHAIFSVWRVDNLGVGHLLPVKMRHYQQNDKCHKKMILFFFFTFNSLSY